MIAKVILFTLIYTGLGRCDSTLDRSTNYFQTPPASSDDEVLTADVVWSLGSTQTLYWATTLESVYTINLWWHNVSDDNSYQLGQIYSSNAGDVGSQSYQWTVTSLDNASLVPGVFFFWLFNTDDSSESFTSHYFNITTSAASTTSSTTTSSSSTTTTTSTTTSSSVSSTTSSGSTSSSPAASTTSSDSGDNLALPVGLGVGLGLGIPLVIIAGVWVGLKAFRRRSSPGSQGGAAVAPFSDPKNYEVHTDGAEKPDTPPSYPRAVAKGEPTQQAFAEMAGRRSPTELP